VTFSRLRVFTGSFLVLAGAAVLAAALTGYLRGVAWQRTHAADEDIILVPKGTHTPSLRPGEPFARLAIPKIDLDVLVVEGTRRKDLLKGPGHLAGSGAPGAPDNCIIAGHRDLHFRGLNRLVPGDLIRLQSERIESDYRVVSARVISPDDTTILAPGTDAVLTLITCYPFHFVGPAPKRYVVRARLVEEPRARI
jgi:sortase A